MRRDNAQFKAEVFRRFDDYKIKRKKRLMAAGGAALSLMLFVGVMWVPITSYLTPSPSETTDVGKITTVTSAEITTTEEATLDSDKIGYENFHSGTQDRVELDGELTTICTAEGVLPESITVRCGLRIWRLTNEEEIAALCKYLSATEESPATYGGIAEAATVAAPKKYTLLFFYADNSKEEFSYNSHELETFLQKLKENESK